MVEIQLNIICTDESYIALTFYSGKRPRQPVDKDRDEPDKKHLREELSETPTSTVTTTLITREFIEYVYIYPAVYSVI